MNRTDFKKKAVKEVIQVLTDNNLTASECRCVLKVAKHALKERPLNKDFSAQIESIPDFNFEEEVKIFC